MGYSSGVVKFGFELTAEDGSNSKVGTFIITDPTQTQLKNGGNAVTHTSAGNTPYSVTSFYLQMPAPVSGM